MFDFSNASPAMRRMLKARAKIAQQHVFFSSVIYAARLVETKACKTMRTNGSVIQFNPDYVLANNQYIEGVLLHEYLHKALLHPWRKGWRKADKWNVVCDWSVNPLVMEYFKLPPDHQQCPPQFSGMTPERMYDEMEDQEEEGEGEGEGEEGEGESGGKWPKGSEPMQDPSDPQDGDGEGDGEDDQPYQSPEDAEQEQRRNTMLAAQRGMKAGNLPGELKDLIEQITPKARLDYRAMLRNWVRDAKEDHARSWARPNRRMLAHDLYLPGKGKDKISKLVLCLDSSGSVNMEVSKEMKAEAASLLDQSLVDTVVMISTDTKVCNLEVVTTSEQALKFDLGRHGGGTQFDAAMKKVGEHSDAIGCLFFTDMETASFGPDPKIPVIWVNWGRSGLEAPYGKTALYKDK